MADVHRRRAPADDAGEAGGLVLEIPEHRPRQLGAVAHAAAVVLLAAGVDLDQLVGALDRQRPQRHLVEEREHRRVGADAERDRDDRDEGEERRAGEAAGRQAQVGQEVRHAARPVRAACQSRAASGRRNSLIDAPVRGPRDGRGVRSRSALCGSGRPGAGRAEAHVKLRSSMKTVRHLAIVLGVGIAASGAYLSAQQPPPEREIGKLYGELCANCHGPKLEGAQFGSLVDDTWQFGSADADLARMIQKGNPGGMPPFEAVLSPQEVRAMVIYIREVGARAKREKTTFNKPAANVVVTSEKATFRLETRRRGRDRAMGPRLPSRRPHPRHREGRQAPDRREGAAAARAGHRHPGGARQGPGRAARRRRAPRLPPQRLDLPVVQRPRRERQRDDEDRPRQAEGQRLRRDPGHLQGAGRALHRRPEPLRRPHRVRPQGAHLLQHRRARPGAARAGAEPAERQGAPDQRGRHHPEGQPVRRQAAGAWRRSTPTATATRRA